MTEQRRRELDSKLVKVVPTERQIAHQQMEFYGFIHFTVNTFTGKEWGEGTESESIFEPTALDASQWAKAAKDGGMTGLILTCKHHDGFCLWPSAYTSHTVANSPYKEGKGDIVRELSDACKKEGLKFGVYLSPWDRNSQLYGQGKAYDDYFVAQLTELLTNYGPIFCVWFDGACGEGPNGKKQVYDWDRYYQTIRELQPNACISVSGPDIRWCGNEAGDTRPSEWSVVPEALFDQRKITENSQQADTEEFRERKIADGDRDLGSRDVMDTAEHAIWYPAEVNTSIRPGWFYHEEEDDKVKSLSELQSVYLRSVGGNATFLLNLPPDKRGLFYEADVARLKELGDWIRTTFSREQNLAKQAKEISVYPQSVGEGTLKEEFLTDSYEQWYQPATTEDDDTEQRIKGQETKEQEIKAQETKKPETKDVPAEIRLTWDEEQEIRYIVLKENIRMSQRIESFQVLIDGKEVDGKDVEGKDVEGDSDKILASGTTVGYQKIVCLSEPIKTNQITIRILDSRQAPTLSYLGVFSGK